MEHKLTGIEQVLVLPHDTNAQLDRSFAAVLRAFRRNDPDVIMIGEIRDLETGTIAVKAALVIAAATRAVVAQRLVRRICTRCTEHYIPDPAELAAAGFDPAPAVRKEFRRGTGETRAGIRCDACSGSGYRGRIGLFEVLAITDAIKQCIGLPLHKAMRAHPWIFDRVYTEIVAAGEQAGTLDQMLEPLAAG